MKRLCNSKGCCVFRTHTYGTEGQMQSVQCFSVLYQIQVKVILNTYVAVIDE